jgi:hypothetical protein
VELPFYPPFAFMLLWCGQGQLYIYSYSFVYFSITILAKVQYKIFVSVKACDGVLHMITELPEYFHNYPL